MREYVAVTLVLFFAQSLLAAPPPANGCTLAGRVLSEDGAPVVNFPVYLKRKLSFGKPAVAQTLRDGTYSFACPRAGVWVIGLGSTDPGGNVPRLIFTTSRTFLDRHAVSVSSNCSVTGALDFSVPRDVEMLEHYLRRIPLIEPEISQTHTNLRIEFADYLPR